MRSWATARVQVPLAATVAVVLVAAVVLERTVAEVAPDEAHVGLAAIAIASLVVNRLLFLRTNDRRQAYVRAIWIPPMIGAVLGPVIVGFMRFTHPDADYSFGGAPMIDVGDAWWAFVAIGSAMASMVASAFLALQVWLITRSERSHVAVWTWCSVLGVASAAFWIAPLAALIASGVGACGLTFVLWEMRSRKAELLPATSPYR